MALVSFMFPQPLDSQFEHTPIYEGMTFNSVIPIFVNIIKYIKE